jgi:hypothetical protein
MKFLINLIILTLLFIADVKAQQPPDTILPPDIVTEFKGRFKDINPSEWTKSGDNYVITFLKDTKWYEATYSKKAKLLGLNILINYDDLPDAVKKKFDASIYKDFDIQKILEIQTADQKKNYQITLLNANEDEITILFSDTGELLK